MKPDFAIILLIFSITLFSCKTKSTDIAGPEPGLIEITKAQFQSEKMEFGEPSLSPFYDLVHFTGTVIPSVNGRAQISLPAQGLITRIYCKPGQLVGKGAVLFEVSGNEFIDMQKDFAEIKNFGTNALVSNQFVEGDIIVSSDSVFSLPESAILKLGNETFVLVLEKETDELFYLSKLKVNMGRKNNEFIEITEMPESKKILIKGVYNILIE